MKTAAQHNMGLIGSFEFHPAAKTERVTFRNGSSIVIPRSKPKKVRKRKHPDTLGDFLNRLDAFERESRKARFVAK
jgi:hypothetical protein